MTGFHDIIRDCSFNFGAIEDPTEAATLIVKFQDGSVRHVDAIGIDKQGNTMIVMGFSWRTVNPAAKRKDEELPDGPVFMLEFVAPFDKITMANVDCGNLFE